MILVYVIGIFVVCVCYAYYVLVRNYNVPDTTNGYADPLLADVALTVVQTHKFDRNRIKRIYSIDDSRCDFLLYQLNQCGILEDTTVQVSKISTLTLFFNMVNSDEMYFTRGPKRLMLDAEKRIKKLQEKTSSTRDLDIIDYYLSIREELVQEYNLKWIQKFDLKGPADEDLKQIQKSIANKPGLNFQVEAKKMQEFDLLKESFKALQPYKIWDKETKQLTVEFESFYNLTVNGMPLSVPVLAQGEQKYYFYPTFILVSKISSSEIDFGILDYKDLLLQKSKLVLKADKWFDETDAKLNHKTYLHPDRKGDPDPQYKYNPEISYYDFYKVTDCLDQVEFISGSQQFLTWTDSYNNYRALLTGSQYGRARKNNPVPQGSTTDKPKRQRKVKEKETVETATETPQQTSSQPSKQPHRFPTQLCQEIRNVIEKEHLSKDVIQSAVFLNILQDYGVFQAMENKAYARILSDALRSGVISKVLDKTPDSLEGKDEIYKFINTYGYDTQKANDIILCVYHAQRLALSEESEL